MNNKKTTNTSEEKKVKYTTVGTIKTIVLTKGTYAFTFEPISAYRFLTKDDDDSSWKIVFKEDKEDKKTDDKKKIKDVLPKLSLVAQDAMFTVKDKLADALMALKQNKAKIEIEVESTSGMEGDEFVVTQITVK